MNLGNLSSSYSSSLIKVGFTLRNSYNHVVGTKVIEFFLSHWRVVIITQNGFTKKVL